MFLAVLLMFFGGLLLVIITGRLLLPLLIRLKVGQAIRSDGPRRHLAKAGTPTMGGLFFIVAMLALVIFLPGKTPRTALWLFSFLAFALIGFLDDYTKLRHRQNQGLTGRQKLAGQFMAAALLLLGNAWYDPHPTLILHLSGQPWFDLGWWYYPLMAVFIVGMVNAVNLTDGLDGLAAGVSFSTAAGFAITCSVTVYQPLAQALGNYGDLSLLAVGLAGCCLGFLFYNRYPARVFMGDIGSMALGGAMTGLALAANQELLLIGFGFVYLAEALSVMLQVASFQLTRRRIFLMAPLHHHFELKGFKETKVTALFSLASAVCVFVTLLLCAVF